MFSQYELHLYAGDVVHWLVSIKEDIEPMLPMIADVPVKELVFGRRLLSLSMMYSPVTPSSSGVHASNRVVSSSSTSMFFRVLK